MRMKKLLLFLLSVFLFAGCTIVKINTDDYISNINTILSRKSNYTNRNAIGYQYYLPSSVVVTEVNDFNQTLYSKGDNYYLYVDLVSYYHKVDISYELNEEAYLSKGLAQNNKYGYVEVNKDKDYYFVEMMYNYAKIESYVKKGNLIDALNNMAYILSSVKFNDDIIESMLGSEKYNLSENETYNIFETKKKVDDSFIKYNEEYGKYDGDDAVDLIEKKEINQEKGN